MNSTDGVSFFRDDPAAGELFRALLKQLERIGPFRVEEKITCLHLVRKTAFVGVHPRRHALLLTVKSDTNIQDPRIGKAEQTSKSRWHLDVRLSSEADVDEQLLSWIRAAYELSG